MTLKAQAQQIVLDADLRLKALLEQALAEKRYADLTALSRIAEELFLIIADFELEPGDPSSDDQPAQSRSASKKAVYPYFRRDGEKLVKVGWSKKERTSYEHRAPKETVLKLAAELSTRVSEGTAFKMEDFVPLRMAKGKEVPAYQSYLALAWFRTLGVVHELGKSGYGFKKGALDVKQIEKQWEALPELDK